MIFVSNIMKKDWTVAKLKNLLHNECLVHITYNRERLNIYSLVVLR